jgi:DNA-directed RNA polymerase specialized sigma24 family protein
VRATYARDFRAALEAVLASTGPDDRAILRMHYLETRNIEEVGAALGLHRATIARRLHRIRDAILHHTAERLRADAGLDSEEVDALLACASREVDVSLARILAHSK